VAQVVGDDRAKAFYRGIPPERRAAQRPERVSFRTRLCENAGGCAKREMVLHRSRYSPTTLANILGFRSFEGMTLRVNLS
jgi:hypothetical protein